MSDDLTVVIPAFNAASTIQDAVSSAHAVGATRVLVINDGSTDTTAELLEGLECEVRDISNGGVARARRIGVTFVETPFLILLDADDCLRPRGVTAALEQLRADPVLSACGGSVVNVRPDGRAEEPHSTYGGFRRLTADDLVKRGVGPWPPGAAVIRTDSFHAISNMHPRPLDPPRAEDYEMFIRLSIVGEIGVTEEPTLNYRVHVGKSSRSAFQSMTCREQIRRHYIDALGISARGLSRRAIRSDAHLLAVRSHLSHRRLALGLLNLMAAVLFAPLRVIRKVRDNSGQSR